MTLTDFLLARIAEDEEHARFDGAHWVDCEHFVAFSEGGMPCACNLDARVLAECEAKRQILNGALPPFYRDLCLRALALPYADHPDCREEWKL